MKKLLYLSTLILLLSNCRQDTEITPCPLPQVVPFQINFTHLYDGDSLKYQKTFTSPQGNPIWFNNKKYYLSNLKAIHNDGSFYEFSKIELIDLESGPSYPVLDSLPEGDYSGFEFSLGVDSIMNNQDPNLWPFDHPLHVSNAMYWTWSTMYIFAQIEGQEVDGNDTIDFFIHAGTNSLFRPNIKVNTSFTVSKNGSASIELDIHQILDQPAYTFNLTTDGKSHTMNNYPLAVQYMDNFSSAFN